MAFRPTGWNRRKGSGVGVFNFVPFSPSFVRLERDDFCSPQAGPLSLECGGLTPLWLCLSFCPLLEQLSCNIQS